MTTSKTGISYSYSVFSFVLDEKRGQTIPVGVALWSPQKRWVQARLVKAKERLKGFSATEHFPLVRAVQDKIEHWIETGKLPYQESPVPPSDDHWWRHVRNLLVHRVRLSEPRPIDCRDPDDELSVLFESIVAPYRPAQESRTRIDSEIRKCLDGLANKFKGRRELPGYGNRKVRVQRAYQGSGGCIVIEGVNLASQQAESQADSAASKLMRLREGVSGKCELLIGYLASPEGLNGEKVLVQWLCEKTHAKAFDLMKDRIKFRETAEQLVDSMGDQLTLFHEQQVTEQT